MLALMWIALMLGLAYRSFRSARRALNGATAQESVADDRFARGRDGEADRDVAHGPENAAEATESVLSRQLFHGDLDREGYQRAMAELARSNSSKPGGVR